MKKRQIQMPIFSERQRRVLIVDPNNASKIGRYLNAVQQFLASNDAEVLLEFVGTTVDDVDGRQYILETRPNVLYGLTQGPDITDQVYRILK